MQLSKTAYYADFIIYALIITALAAVAAADPQGIGRLRWLGCFVVGALLWTLLEYLLHRFVLHRMPVTREMHAVHHASPRAFVGTPTWLTLALLWSTIFLPAWWGGNFELASGLVAGVMLGFLGYGVVHHVIHYRRPRFLSERLRVSRYRHLQHHHAAQPGNFGVTTALWDRLFGTVCAEMRGHPRRDQPARLSAR